MNSLSPRFDTVNEYLNAFPPDIKKLLQQLRDTIRKAAPQAEETISYNMPAFKLSGNLVYFAGYKNHIGFYPMPSGIDAFSNELAAYKGAKGSVQFPVDKPLPLSLIGKIVKFRVKENLEKAAAAKGKKKTDDFLSELSAPAQRALQRAGITSLKKLSASSEKELLSLHGFGPASLPILRNALKRNNLSFKTK